MIRLVAVAILVVIAWLAIIRLIRFLKAKDVDWNGVAFAAGFVALAFYLRHVTGLG